MNNILFIPIWTSDWVKFKKIINILNNIDEYVFPYIEQEKTNITHIQSHCLENKNDELILFKDTKLNSKEQKKEKNKKILSIFDHFIHINKNKEELNSNFHSIYFNYFFKRGLLIQHIYNYIKENKYFDDIMYYSFIFEDNIDIFTLNNLNNLNLNFLNNNKDYNINYIEKQNLFFFPKNILDIFINELYENENINDLFFLEKIHNIYNIKSFSLPYKELQFPKFNIFNNFYFSLITLNKLKKYTFIIIIENIQDFYIKYINLILYLPINYKNIFIIFDKKCIKKELIYQEIKFLLNKFSYIYIIYDFPCLNIEKCIEDIIKFTNFKDYIYKINIKLIKKSFEENNIDLFFDKLENILNDNSSFSSKNFVFSKSSEELYINNESNKINSYKEEDYYKLLNFNKININYLIYNKKFLDTKTILSLKKNWIEKNFDKDNNENLIDNYFINEEENICFEELKKKFNFEIQIINLETRYDRYCNIQKEFDNLNIEYNIFKGIKKENISEVLNENNKIIDIEKLLKQNKNNNYIIGSLGCKLSHIDILKKYKNSNNLDYIIIFEDDFTFSNLKYSPFFFINNALNELILNKIEWNILYLSTTNFEFEYNQYLYNLKLKYIKKIKKYTGFTTSAYIVPIKNIHKIIDILNNNLDEIDVVFTNYLEDRYMIIPSIGYQKEDFSNILTKNVNYNYLI